MLELFIYLPVILGHYVETQGVERDEIFAMLTMSTDTDYHFCYYLN